MLDDNNELKTKNNNSLVKDIVPTSQCSRDQLFLEGMTH